MFREALVQTVPFYTLFYFIYYSIQEALFRE